MTEQRIGLLLHTCCGPCACGCLGRLKAEGRRVTLYFSNSNINSRDEFEKRLEEVRKVSVYFDVPLLVDDYCHEDWLKAVSEVDDYACLPERGARCTACFGWSLGRTAQKAQELGMAFATTLTVSPHKNSTVIFAIGHRYGNFEEYDFKKQNGYLISTRLSRELRLYRQCYCGCEFSMQHLLCLNGR